MVKNVFGISLVLKSSNTLGFVGVKALRFEDVMRDVTQGSSVKSADVAYGAQATGDQNLDSFYLKEKGEDKIYFEGGKRPDHMLFESIARDKALDMLPVICCPNCGTATIGPTDGRQLYHGSLDLGSPPTGCDAFQYLLVYTCGPCGCKVSPEWVAEFTKEINRRKAGETPLPVTDMDSTKRHQKVRALEKVISMLYSLRDAAEEGNQRRRIEYYLVMAVDQLMRLIPGPHNCVTPVHLSEQVADWADTHGYHKPAEPALTAQPDPAWGYNLKYPVPDFQRVSPQERAVLKHRKRTHEQRLHPKLTSCAVPREGADEVEKAQFRDYLCKEVAAQRQEEQVNAADLDLAKRTCVRILEVLDDQPKLAQAIAVHYLLGGHDNCEAAALVDAVKLALRKFVDDGAELDTQTLNYVQAVQAFVVTTSAAGTLATPVPVAAVVPTRCYVPASAVRPEDDDRRTMDVTVD